MRIPLAAQSYRARSLPLSAQRLVNLYAELAPPDAKAKLVLYGTPGLRDFASVGQGPIRGTHEMRDQAFVVSGLEVYLVDASGTGTLLGTIGGSDPVIMADNGTQVAIVTPDDAGKAYIATTTTCAQITDTDFPDVSSVAYLDGYFLFSTLDSDQFIISAIRDGTAYDALDFATAESNPDELRRVFVDHSEVWLFGTKSIELFTNTGAAAFPFERVAGGRLEKGCAAALSPAKINNAVLWLGTDRCIYSATGFAPAKISTPAIDEALRKLSRIDDAIGLTYSQGGHDFYCLQFPSAGVTFSYDLTTQFWHERESGNGARWRVANIVDCYGQLIAGDYRSNALYVLDLDTFSDAGAAIIRSATSPPIHAETKAATMSRFEVEFEAGVGLTSGQGSTPQAMLDWSDDGGLTWSNQLVRSIGAIGAFTWRSVWRRLGQFRAGRVMRLSVSDPVKVTIIAANADIVPGTS